MAVAVERKFLDDTGSLKSFRQDDLASAPLSQPRIASFKSKKSRLEMSALYRRLWAESDDFNSGGIKNKDCNTLFFNPLQGRKPEEMSHARGSYREPDNNARSQNRPVTIQRKLTRSKTISRLFSSKILAGSSSTPPTSSQPLLRSRTRIASAFGSKETRDAALRERGLLPPLKPNVDLSSAERERDRHLPVLTPPQSGEAFSVDGGNRRISAAARVKQEWEAKYKVIRELEENKSLNLPPSPGVKECSLTEQPSASAEHSSHLEVPNSALLATTSVSSIKGTQLSTAHALSNDLDDPDYLIQQLHFPSSEPYHIPLPPSPSPSFTFLCSQEDFSVVFLTASPPLPPSPGLSASPDRPTITVTTPVTHASPPPSKSPTGSKSSHPTVVDNATPLVMATPTQITPVNTTAPTLLDNGDVVMTESPVETSLTGLCLISGCPCNSSDFKVAITSDVSAAGSADLPKVRVRNHTDPSLGGGLKTHQAEPRRSSFNFFKRPTDHLPNIASPRRLSMGASFNNMRRSFVGTFSRTKAAGLTVKTDQGPDASHLPPSPTPAYADQAGASSAAGLKFLQEQKLPASPEPKLRVSVSPTLYSRGTIVAEMNTIDDEESRRMTELAFLG